MQKSHEAELKYLAMFLLTIIAITALTWGVMEISVSKTKRALKPKKTVARNLAPEKEIELEKVPIISENYETYQFKDPFQPLSTVNVPEENKLPDGVGSGSDADAGTDTGTDTGSDTDTGSETTTGLNSTTNINSIPKVIDIKNDGAKSSATIKVNGKTYIGTEGQTVGNNTIIDINKADGSVEFLQGDQRFSVPLDKG